MIEVDDDLIAKYLSGEATPEEAMALNDWLGVPANKIRFQELENTWNKVNPVVVVRKINKDEAWRKVQPTRSIGFSIGIAASIMLVLFVGAWLYVQTTSVAELSAVATDSTRGVMFADHSRATLYRNTSIEYPDEFKGKRREVKLVSGEAFFSVEKDPSKPFVVHASFADIKVVGTQFDVSIRDEGVEISVKEGKVFVSDAVDSTYLTAGSSAIFYRNKKSIKKESDPNTWAYASGRLEFRDTPIRDVIDAVERTYGQRIQVSNDRINNCVLKASFDGDSFEDVVHLISETLDNIKLEQNGKVFILQGEGCPPQ